MPCTQVAQSPAVSASALGEPHNSRVPLESLNADRRTVQLGKLELPF